MAKSEWIHPVPRDLSPLGVPPFRIDCSDEVDALELSSRRRMIRTYLVGRFPYSQAGMQSQGATQPRPLPNFHIVLRSSQFSEVSLVEICL